jgi:rhomboid protease GluP
VSRRVPWLTLGVFVVTSAVTAAMYLRWPELGPLLQRDPKMLQGEWWRFVTTWLVLTDGWSQVILNSAGLLIYGTLVEQTIDRRWWVVAYVVAGLAGELVGIFWQPVGGGNSVAICGLIGLYSVWVALRPSKAGPPPLVGTVVWGGIGLWLITHSDIHGAALCAGFIVGAVAWAISGRTEEQAQ